MKSETVLIVHKDKKILLGMKNPKKFGGNKWNGFGGKVKPGETTDQAAIRESFEEGGIKIKNLRKLGEILFRFETDEPDHQVHFYKAKDYEGILKESNELIRFEWFPEDKLPINEMWLADRYWLPFFIQNKEFRGVVVFDNNFKVKMYEINEAVV